MEAVAVAWRNGQVEAGGSTLSSVSLFYACSNRAQGDYSPPSQLYLYMGTPLIEGWYESLLVRKVQD